MPKTLELQGIKLTWRVVGTIGQLRALALLGAEYGVDLLGGVDPDAFQKLFLRPGGIHALLRCLFTGPVDEVVEDDLTVDQVRGVLEDFFGVSGQPSTGRPAGSHPDPSGSGPSESPATS